VYSHMAGSPKGGYISRIEPSYKEEGTAYVTIDNHRSSDFAVYIYKTTNFGDSWTRISNGIPPEAGTVHVIREDPAAPNLLFAGTEFGLYVSFNRGQNWEKMKNGLPPVPIFDLQIHPRDHDLILATHGRSLLILDKITALEDAANSESFTGKDLHLFTSLPAIKWQTVGYRGFLGSRNFYGANPQPGLLLDYYLQSAGPVTVVVKDTAGATMRTLNARGEAGMNRLAWDLRMDPPVPVAGRGGRGGAGAGGAGAGGGRGGRGGGGATPGADPAFAAPETGGATAEAGGNPEAGGGGAGGGGGGGGRGGRGGFGGGSLVDRGQYTVTLTASGKSETATVTVQDDPRRTLSDADIARRRTAIARLSALAKQADDNRRKVIAMNTSLTNLQDAWKRPGVPAVPDAARKLVEDMQAKVKAILPSFEAAPPAAPAQLGAAGSRGPYVPPPVNQKITRLMGGIDGFSGPPTARQLAEVEEAAQQLQQASATVDTLYADFPKLNKALAEAGAPYMGIDLNAVPAPTGGRGGGQR